MSAGALRQLWVKQQGSTKRGTNGAASSLMFAKFSPDATRVAYVRANNIYVERLDTGKVTALTTDGSETTINGTSDWVYEEELGLRDCFRWSPDGRRIAYWQFDTTGVGIFSLINDTASLYPTITRIPYPKAGTTNSAVRIGVVSAAGGKTRWMQTPGDPRNNYLARLEWIDEETVAMQQLNRLQNRNDFLLADVRTGSVSRIFATSRRRGSTRSTRSTGSMTGARSCGSASATAGGTSIACRFRRQGAMEQTLALRPAATPRSSRVSTPT